MKIFIDSADLSEIKQAYEWGIADGITTNPSLMKKAVNKCKLDGEDINLKGYIKEILLISKDTPVSLEVTETTAQRMIEEGRKLYEMFKEFGNVNIKIPINPSFEENNLTHFDGIKAIKKLSEENIPINCTLIFTPEQALLAAKAGAAFVSPFAGRVDDNLRKRSGMNFNKTDYFPMEGISKNDNGIVSGIDLVKQCVQILRQYNLKTEVLAASLRNTRQVREAALIRADIATLPFDVIRNMLKHSQTFEGMKKFTADVVEEYKNLL
ncbi:MAG: transaldolase family protein [Nanoarchaeota archaeon]|nr:transaldolase [Nanoarchaeota archaeon]MBU1631636.1 transaldolase [Nanoarchaeota archaeon]MBU1875649.1 transaldolase [Nanoarchaeota archaeon]